MKEHGALLLLSAALIAFQLELMQLLTILQWHNFAWLVISISLLGFGASGSIIALFRSKLIPRMSRLIPLLLYCCGAMMVVSGRVLQNLPEEFDIQLIFVTPIRTFLLLAFQLLFFLVFFLGALPIGMLFVRYTERIGGLYFSNMVGSGLGGILAIVMMEFLPPKQLPAITALLPLIAAFLLLGAERKKEILLGSLLVGCILFSLLKPPDWKLSPYKSLSKVMNLPGAEIVAEDSSSLGVSQLVKAPALRYAPGLSLSFQGKIPDQSALFHNGNWFGPVSDEVHTLIKFTAAAFPYELTPRKQILLLLAGTAVEVDYALEWGAERVVVVEPNRTAIHLLQRKPHRAVSLKTVRPESWLSMDPERYDLITLPTVGSFGGNSGLFALRERYHLTRESFEQYQSHLKPDGVLRVAAWLDFPRRNSLKLLATLVEAMEKNNLKPSEHLMAIAGWDMVTFFIKRQPWKEVEIRELLEFCDRLQFDPILYPGKNHDSMTSMHQQTGGSLFKEFQSILSKSTRYDFYQQHDFKLRPATLENPFFSQFLRWEKVPKLLELYGERSLPFLEVGYFIVLIALVQLIFLVFFLILLPLFRMKRSGKGRRKNLIYFGGIGCGYLFFEILMIHQLNFYLGDPVRSAAVAIGALLFFSGLGGLFSNSLSHWFSIPAFIAGLITLIIPIYYFMSPFVFQQTINWSGIEKIVAATLFIAPIAIIMGFLFPIGLRLLTSGDEQEKGWAWGVNGCFSVLSATIATMVAVEFGFSMVMIFSTVSYALAGISGIPD